MLYFQQKGLGFQKWQAAFEFGPYTDIVEVLDDQYANRHIVLFDTGQILHYDREHWVDEFGRLMGSKFSKQPKWMKGRRSLVLISAEAFEVQWRQASSSPLWSQQKLRSLTGKYPTPTFGLTMR
jgi:hypothetical protein